MAFLPFDSDVKLSLPALGDESARRDSYDTPLVLVPEPGTALFFGLGLAGSASSAARGEKRAKGRPKGFNGSVAVR
jgi:hypothetical protein